MVMPVTQVRLPQGLIEQIDGLVDKGYYSNRSDVVRDAVRKLVLDKVVGISTYKGDSVREVRSTRKKLSKERID